MPKVIMVNILNFNIFEYKEYVSESMLVLKEHRENEISDLVKYYYIELPKYRKAKADMNNKLDQWLAFIDDTDWGKIEMAEEKNKTIKSALDDMEYLTGDAEIKRLAELRESSRIDKWFAMSYGRKQGEKIGENKAKKETAKRMLEMNISMDIIIKATGLTEEEIEKIKRKIIQRYRVDSTIK